MSPFPCSTLADWAGGILLGSGRLVATRVWTDSRSIRPGDLFVALRGERFDAHAFLGEIAASGAIGAIIEPLRLPDGLPPDFVRIEVADTGLAYQRLAAHWRRELEDLRVVAITGSNGKTSTKDFAAAILRRRFHTASTRGNLNNHVGLPHTILTTETADEAAVWELGMNHFGEIAPLAAIATPQVAIISNVGMAHLEFLRTRAGIAWEKGRVLEAVAPDGLVVLPADDDFFSSLAARSPVPVITVGIGSGDFRAEKIVPNSSGSSFEMISPDGERTVASLSVPGRHMITNALLAVAAGRHFGLSLDECAAGLAEAVLTGGRLERRSVGSRDFLDDTYNANPDSVVAALATLAAMPMAGRRFAILGRMGELGGESVQGHRHVGAAAAKAGLDGLCVVGRDAVEIAKAAKENGLEAENVADIAEAIDWVCEKIRPGDLTLVKASRSAALERLFEGLKEFP